MEASTTGKIVALSIVAVGIALPTILIIFHCCFFCFSSKRPQDIVEIEGNRINVPLSKISEEHNGEEISFAIGNDNIYLPKNVKGLR